MNAALKWADIPECPGFRASDDGLIVNKKGKILKQWREADNGAYRVRINGRNRMVSHLVLTAHTGRPPYPGYYPRNADRDRSNNAIDNLIWAGKPREFEWEYL